MAEANELQEQRLPTWKRALRIIAVLGTVAFVAAFHFGIIAVETFKQALFQIPGLELGLNILRDVWNSIV